MSTDNPEPTATRRAAIHQAGVVVAMARFNGVRWPVAVWLDANGGAVQSVLDTFPEPPRTDQEIWGEFAARHGGLVSERIVLASVAASGVSNVLRAEQLLSMLLGPTAVGYPRGPSAIIPDFARIERHSGPADPFTETMQVVERFIRDDRDAIVALATVLEARGRLDGAALRAVLADVLAEPSGG